MNRLFEFVEFEVHYCDQRKVGYCQECQKSVFYCRLVSQVSRTRCFELSVDISHDRLYCAVHRVYVKRIIPKSYISEVFCRINRPAASLLAVSFAVSFESDSKPAKFATLATTGLIEIKSVIFLDKPTYLARVVYSPLVKKLLFSHHRRSASSGKSSDRHRLTSKTYLKNSA